MQGDGKRGCKMNLWRGGMVAVKSAGELEALDSGGKRRRRETMAGLLI
jgi:hypothetical protein